MEALRRGDVVSGAKPLRGHSSQTRCCRMFPPLTKVLFIFQYNKIRYEGPHALEGTGKPRGSLKRLLSNEQSQLTSIARFKQHGIGIISFHSP